MKNFTIFNQSAIATFNFRPKVWLLDTVIHGILVLITLYLLLALLFYQLKVEKPQRGLLPFSVEKKYGVLSKYICILVAFASFFRQSISFARSWIDFFIAQGVWSLSHENLLIQACKVVPHLGVVTISIGISLVLLFLWLRQRVIYIHPALKILSNKFVTYFSFGVFIVWLIFYIALYPAYFSLVYYNFSSFVGCSNNDETFEVFRKLIIVWTATSMFLQISLLFLFTYPICKQALWKDQQKQFQNFYLLRRVKKSVILTSICLASYFGAVVAARLIDMPNTNNPTFDFSTCLVINHLAIIACFDYWKQLLWPWTFCTTKNIRINCTKKDEENYNSYSLQLINK